MMELVGKWSEHPKFFLKMVCMLGVGGDYENSFYRIWSISKISLMRITYTAVICNNSVPASGFKELPLCLLVIGLPIL
jgi:hypothetical protein